MILIHRATIINEGKTFEGSVLIEGEKIKKIFYDEVPKNVLAKCPDVIEASGLYLLPGVIDDQVHFREPGPPIKATSKQKAVLP